MRILYKQPKKENNFGLQIESLQKQKVREIKEANDDRLRLVKIGFFDMLLAWMLMKTMWIVIDFLSKEMSQKEGEEKVEKLARMAMNRVEEANCSLGDFILNIQESDFRSVMFCWIYNYLPRDKSASLPEFWGNDEAGKKADNIQMRFSLPSIPDFTNML